MPMRATDIAAWWGAGIATLVFAWDIFKWTKSGTIIAVSALPDMNTYGSPKDELNENTYVVVEARNIGDKKTTITHALGYQYKSWWKKLINKPNKSFLLRNHTIDQELPYVLEPGERWIDGFLQNQELEQMSREGLLYIGIQHTTSKKAILKRVVTSIESAK